MATALYGRGSVDGRRITGVMAAAAAAEVGRAGAIGGVGQHSAAVAGRVVGGSGTECCHFSRFRHAAAPGSENGGRACGGERGGTRCSCHVIGDAPAPPCAPLARANSIAGLPASAPTRPPRCMHRRQHTHARANDSGEFAFVPPRCARSTPHTNVLALYARVPAVWLAANARSRSSGFSPPDRSRGRRPSVRARLSPPPTVLSGFETLKRRGWEDVRRARPRARVGRWLIPSGRGARRGGAGAAWRAGRPCQPFAEQPAGLLVHRHLPRGATHRPRARGVHGRAAGTGRRRWGRGRCAPACRGAAAVQHRHQPAAGWHPGAVQLPGARRRSGQTGFGGYICTTCPRTCASAPQICMNNYPVADAFVLTGCGELRAAGAMLTHTQPPPPSPTTRQATASAPAAW
jgi:hypothetical protein